MSRSKRFDRRFWLVHRMIEFNNVSYTYDGETMVLSDLTFSIERGSFVCILGGNGSGKSTLAKHINALLVPDEGKVTVLGYDTSSKRNVYNIRSNAGMVFQNPDDQLVATLIENDVAFGPENLGVPTDELKERIASSLAGVGLQGFNKNETTALSGGQKQRVAIAGVLAMDPQILILDEASAMLDPRGRSGLMRVCKELNERGMTIVMITHFMEEASLAERVLVLEKGRLALDGAPGEVLTQTELLDRLNLRVPFPARLCRKLQARGVPIDTYVHEDDLKEALCQLLLKT